VYFRKLTITQAHSAASSTQKSRNYVLYLLLAGWHCLGQVSCAIMGCLRYGRGLSNIHLQRNYYNGSEPSYIILGFEHTHSTPPLCSARSAIDPCDTLLFLLFQSSYLRLSSCRSFSNTHSRPSVTVHA
jgi:hypothetical protein